VPKDVIVEEAREWGTDLIVVGSHGYGFAKRLVLGSVAAAVVASAPCSVQVVRTKHPIQAAGGTRSTPRVTASLYRKTGERSPLPRNGFFDLIEREEMQPVNAGCRLSDHWSQSFEKCVRRDRPRLH